MKRILAVAIPTIFGVLSMPALRAQADLRFEVTSVRRVEIPLKNGGVPGMSVTGGVGSSNPLQITYRGAWLLNLIIEAYGVRADQITGPDWVKTTRYDIVANIPEGTTKDQFKVMVGNLLRDRFQLRFHMESKAQPVYALRVAKNGPKFKETARRTGETAGPSKGVGGLDEEGFPILPPNHQGAVSMPRAGELFMAAQDVPITTLLGSIETKAGRPVLDETGLTGHYDFKVHFEWIRRGPATGDPSDPPPDIFVALEQQLGLKLESARRDLDQFIIDSIEREPTEN